MIRSEMKRAFLSRGMQGSLLVGLVIIIWHQHMYVWNNEMTEYNCFCPESVYYNWIGASCFPVQSYLYYFIMPILVCLPAGITYFTDKKSGYCNHVFTRGKRKEYLMAKYIAVFLSGGTTFVIPLIISFYMTALRFPMLRPEAIMDYGPLRTSIGFELYYEHPLLYILLFWVIDFIFAGGMATISLVIAYLTEHRFVVLITPFVFYYFLFAFDNLLGGNDIAPNYFLNPGFEKNNMWEYIVGMVFFVVVFMIYYWRGKKLE